MKPSTRANIVLIAVVTTLLILGVSIGYQIFINATNDRQDVSINSASNQNRKALCAISNNLALAFRQPAPGEGDSHFRDRMTAQLAALNAARGLGNDCQKIRGLENYRQNRSEALDEIHRVLLALNAKHPEHAHSAPQSPQKPSSAPSGSSPTASTSAPAPAPQAAAPSPSSATPPQTSSGGGGTSTGSVGSHPNPPPSSPPPSNPSPQQEPGLLDPVCQLTSPLNLC